jgi:uncharacterized protein
MAFLKYGMLALGGIYLLVTLLMVLFQRELQYFPSHAATTPEAAGLAGTRVIPLRAADAVESQLWYAPAAPGKPTVLYFQGNAGDIADRAPRLAYYQAQGLGVAFLSYRGYGSSRARISEAGLIADATAAYVWLIAQGVPAKAVVLVGESLGSGIAVQLAARNPVGALALEAPYTSAADVAAQIYPWLPVRLLMRDQFRSINHIAAVTAPLLIQHGTADAVIPFAFGAALFAAANQPKTFIPLKGLDHQALFSPETWRREVAFFAVAVEN